MITSAPALLRSSAARTSFGHWQRLHDAQSLVPEIVARHATAFPQLHHAVVRDAQLTSTGIAMLVLASPGRPGPPCAIVKVPVRSAAVSCLQRETAALAALHRDSRLGSWRALLPQPLAEGMIRGKAYRLDSALCGESAAKRLEANVLRRAADAINALHRRTAATLTGGQDVARRWIDRAIAEVAQRGRRSGDFAVRLAALRDELRQAIVGETFTVGWIHGDYWLGNLLITRGGEPCGIVDWETAAPDECVFHDVLHLLLNARRLRTGQELGEVVRRQLLDNGWEEEEEAVIELCGTWGNGCLSERHILLLYWLRQAAMHARQQESGGGFRYRVWERRNVLPVLYSL